MYIHENINGNLPSSLTTIFEPTNQLHGYNTRGASHYQLPIHKASTLVCGIRCINYQSIQFWFNVVCVVNVCSVHAVDLN